MKRAIGWGLVVALLAGVAVTAAFASSGGKARAAGKKKVVIGWAYDQKGQMAPFDDPALAAAKIRASHYNHSKKSKVRFVIKTCDTQNNDPAKAKSCALSLLGAGAKIIFTTCDVDFATPVVQEAIKHSKLAIAPCIGTDQMGPKRFGAKGKLAFSFGNVAQDEGSAMAQYAWKRHWKTAGVATNTLLVYFKNVVQAFDKRFKQLGGKIVDKESYATGQNNVGAAVQRLSRHHAAVYVTSTAFGELPAFVSDMRALHVKTPILNSWAGDGTYWDTKNPKVTNYYCVTFASVFGDDPSKAVRKMELLMKNAGAKPGTGGFLGGADAIDGVYIALKRAHWSLKGAKLAAKLQKFHHVAVLGSHISFSKKLHTVFGREYRVIKTQNNHAKFVGLIKAKVVPTL